jgi:hypothetical protein
MGAPGSRVTGPRQGRGEWLGRRSAGRSPAVRACRGRRETGSEDLARTRRLIGAGVLGRAGGTAVQQTLTSCGTTSSQSRASDTELGAPLALSGRQARAGMRGLRPPICVAWSPKQQSRQRRRCFAWDDLYRCAAGAVSAASGGCKRVSNPTWRWMGRGYASRRMRPSSRVGGSSLDTGPLGVAVPAGYIRPSIRFSRSPTRSYPSCSQRSPRRPAPTAHRRALRAAADRDPGGDCKPSPPVRTRPSRRRQVHAASQDREQRAGGQPRGRVR